MKIEEINRFFLLGLMMCAVYSLHKHNQFTTEKIKTEKIRQEVQNLKIKNLNLVIDKEKYILKRIKEK